MNNYVMDACSLVAFLNYEKGADRVETILKNAHKGKCVIYMSKINLLEIFYGVYREVSRKKAEEELEKILRLPIHIIEKLEDKVFKEAGRLKATYRISLADSIALAEAKIRKSEIVTADHHEFDIIEKKEKINFFWIR